MSAVLDLLGRPCGCLLSPDALSAMPCRSAAQLAFQWAVSDHTAAACGGQAAATAGSGGCCQRGVSAGRQAAQQPLCLGHVPDSGAALLHVPQVGSSVVSEAVHAVKDVSMWHRQCSKLHGATALQQTAWAASPCIAAASRGLTL